MPSQSQAQQVFMGAELARKRAGLTQPLLDADTVALMERSIPENLCGLCGRSLGEQPRHTFNVIVNYGGDTIKHNVCGKHFGLAELWNRQTPQHG